MKRSLSIRVKRAVFSPAMLISVASGLVFLLRTRVLNLISYNKHYHTSLTFRDIGAVFLHDIQFAHAISGYDLFAPVFAVLPAAVLFCEDYNSGYIKSILVREDKKRYIRETLICSSLAGGLAVFIPCFASGMFYLVNGKPNTGPDRWGYATAFDETVYARSQFVWNGLLLFLMLLVLSFLFGAFWSDVGLLISTFLPNRYLVLAMPFALYFSIHLIFYRLGTAWLLFSPVNVLTPAAVFIPFQLFPLLYQGCLLAAVCVMFVKMAERRLSNV